MLHHSRLSRHIREPWQRTLAIMFIAQLFSAMGFSLIFPFLPLYVEDLGTNTSLPLEFWAGMVFSAQAITMMITAPIWGAVADRYGRKLMVQRALFGAAVFLFLMAFARSAEELVLLRALQGMVTGTVSAANALVASITPRERVGFAMGALQVGLWSGVSLGPLVGGVLADSFGFHLPFIITAIPQLVAGVLVWFGVKEPPHDASASHQQSFISEWRHVLSTPGVQLTYSLRFLTSLCRSLIVPIAPLFMLTLVSSNMGVSTFTGLMVGASSATSTFSAIYLGRLGDRMGHRAVIVGCAVGAALLYLPQALVTSPWQLVLLQALAGIAIGGLITAPSALLAVYSTPGEEGAVFGLDNSIVSGGRAAAPLVGSALAVIMGMRGTFAVTALLFLMTALLALWRLPAHGQERCSEEST